MDILLVNTCKDCMYYVPKDEVEGRCHCNPPTVDGFPSTSANAWCGKFIRKAHADEVKLD